MPKASEIKRGQIVDIDAAPHLVKHLEAKAHQRVVRPRSIKSDLRTSSRGKSERRPAKVTKYFPRSTVSDERSNCLTKMMSSLTLWMLRITVSTRLSKRRCLMR